MDAATGTDRSGHLPGRFVVGPIVSGYLIRFGFAVPFVVAKLAAVGLALVYTQVEETVGPGDGEGSFPIPADCAPRHRPATGRPVESSVGTPSDAFGKRLGTAVAGSRGPWGRGP